ncbi:Ketosteroid isomerase-related protein [Chitinophaga jiangningensis]|uniref:Ketosteroid isomerase-related protein n=1 Tax=Chitinophaga jiangningensis TaxID=1419482 RepID=A0A1M7L531_9BACT|nr:nuclear transport factor 2 family protein [Chitinophaga jiangningensis]SHM73164.1 Ketosteroid isomerase-related protein [Chitinophaga jiangningensis]
MSNVWKSIQDIYLALEQGNIGKIMTLIEEDTLFMLDKPLGGTYRGREGLLLLIGRFYQGGSRVSKHIVQMVSQDDRVMVSGCTEVLVNGEVIGEVPFADVWIVEDGRIVEVQLYCLDTALVSKCFL